MHINFACNIEPASLNFNKFKVRISNSIQIFNAWLLFNDPVDESVDLNLYP